MANLLKRLNDLAAPLGVSVELIDFAVPEPGYIVVLKNASDLSTDEINELKHKMTQASTQIRRVVLDIPPT